MKRNLLKVNLLSLVVVSSLSAAAQCAVGESELYITTSGGSFASEKWVDVTTGIDGTGTVAYAQGNGTYGNGAGYLTNQAFCVTNNVDYYFNAYDKYADGWDGTTYVVKDAGGNIIINNGGVSPDDGTDTDASSAFETRATEIEVSEMFNFTPPSCAAPTVLSGVTTTTTADLSWTDPTGSLWNVEYGAAPFTPTGTPTLSGLTDGGNGTPINITGLTSSTDYVYYVQTDCGGGDVSTWSGPFTFTTQCNPLSTFPYSEGFESGASGWTFGGTNSSWAIGTPSGTTINAAANGSNAAVTNLTGVYNANEVSYLYTPCFDFTLVTYPIISFNHIRDLENCCDETWVEYSINGGVTWLKMGVSPVWSTNPYNDASNQWWDSDNTTWTATSVAMPSLAGEGLVKFRFVMSSDGSAQQAGAGVDDFMIENVACPNPSNLATTFVDNDSVIFTWTAGYLETDWNVEVGENGFTPGTGTAVFAGTTVDPADTVGGLTQITDYQIYVQADCGGGDNSDWVGPIDFTSLPNCAAPSNFIAQVLSPDSVALSWSAGSTGETEWTIAYGPSPFLPTDSNATFVSVTTDPNDTITGLMQNTTYSFYVLGNCSASDSSLWVGPETVTTPLFCNNVSGLSATTVIDTAFLSWTAGSNAETMWNVEYGPVGFALGTGTMYSTMNNNTDTLVGLMGSAVYQYYVQAACASGDTSLFTGPFNFTMPLSNDVACDAIELPVDGVDYFFSNNGAAASTDETTNISVPGGSGGSSCSSNDGWCSFELTLSRTVWFSFTAPASGIVNINCGATGYDGQVAIFELTDCNDMTTATILGANDDDPAGGLAPNVTVCGLTAGNTYYVMHDEYSGTGAGTIAMNLTEITVDAGTSGAATVCALDSVDLNSVATINDPNGFWNFDLNPNTIVDDTLFNASSVPAGTQIATYYLIDGCAIDSVQATLTILAPGQSGTAVAPFTVCNAGDVFLPDGLTGSVETGGVWSDDSNTGLLAGQNGNVFVANGVAVGTYPFTYTVSNGVCPDASTTVTVTLTNCVGVDENSLEVSVYPNPNDGIFNILSDVSEEVIVTVLDAQGKVVYNNKLNITAGSPNVVSMGTVETGMYFLKIASDSKVSTSTFMVK